jgi:hypothetical protein
MVPISGAGGETENAVEPRWEIRLPHKVIGPECPDLHS